MEHKTCTRCQMTKPISAFPWGKDKRLLAGGAYKSQCKACASDRAKAWQAENYDRAFKTQKTWRQANRPQWNKSMRKITNRRSSAVERQTPPWADLDKIAEVYRRAAEIRELGVDCEVDHVVPLQGRTARGLHVHWNLQILLKTDNAKKRNTVDPDCHHLPLTL